MKDLENNKVYSLKKASSEQLSETLKWLSENDSGWSFSNNEDYSYLINDLEVLFFFGGEWEWKYKRDLEVGTDITCITSLFYEELTLLNTSINCSSLTYIQVSELIEHIHDLGGKFDKNYDKPTKDCDILLLNPVTEGAIFGFYSNVPDSIKEVSFEEYITLGFDNIFNEYKSLGFDASFNLEISKNMSLRISEGWVYLAIGYESEELFKYEYDKTKKLIEVLKG